MVPEITNGYHPHFVITLVTTLLQMASGGQVGIAWGS